MKETHLKKGEIGLYLNTTGQLMPLDAESAERYLKLKRDVPYVFTMKKARNYAFHQKYFSLISLAFKNQEKFDDLEWFRKWTTISIGECSERIDPFTGVVSYEAKSISFDKCKESEFENIYSKTIKLFMEKFCYDDNFFNKLRSYD